MENLVEVSQSLQQKPYEFTAFDAYVNNELGEKFAKKSQYVVLYVGYL